MASKSVPADQVQRFYRAGALGLRALQDRGLSAERFGSEAAARWRAFKGELNDSARLDLLLRDGAAQYPLAFAARDVFSLEGLADDEPFGPEWVSLPPSKSGPILREVEAATPTTLAAVLGVVADIWGLGVAGVSAGALNKVSPASRWIVAGAGAVIGLASVMADRTDTDLGDQMLLVTAQPGLRQLAGLAAALTGSRRAPRCTHPDSAPTLASDQGFDRAASLLLSADASELDAAGATAMAAALGV